MSENGSGSGSSGRRSIGDRIVGAAHKTAKTVRQAAERARERLDDARERRDLERSWAAAQRRRIGSLERPFGVAEAASRRDLVRGLEAICVVRREVAQHRSEVAALASEMRRFQAEVWARLSALEMADADTVILEPSAPIANLVELEAEVEAPPAYVDVLEEMAAEAAVVDPVGGGGAEEVDLLCSENWEPGQDDLLSIDEDSWADAVEAQPGGGPGGSGAASLPAGPSSVGFWLEPAAGFEGLVAWVESLAPGGGGGSGGGEGGGGSSRGEGGDGGDGSSSEEEDGGGDGGCGCPQIGRAHV